MTSPLRKYVVQFHEAQPEFHPEWLVEGFVMKGMLNMVNGADKSHKSVLRRYMLSCMLFGEHFLGEYSTTKPERILSIVSEDHVDFERMVLELTMREWGLEVPAEEWPLQWLHRAPIDLLKPESCKQIAELAQEDGCDLITIDPLVNYHSANENSNDKGIDGMGKIMENLRTITDEYGITVLITHHQGKPGQNDSNRTAGQMGRGATVVAGAVDFNTAIRRHGDALDHTIKMSGKYAASKNFQARVLPQTTRDDLPPYPILWVKNAKLTIIDICEILLKFPDITVPEISRKLGRRDEDVRKLAKTAEEKGYIECSRQAFNKQTYRVVRMPPEA